MPEALRTGSRPTRAMLVGGNFRGKGAEAMMLTTIGELRRRLPSLEFVLIAGPHDGPPGKRRAEAEALPLTLIDRADGSRTPRCLPRVLRGMVRRVANLKQFRNVAADCDAIIDIRGYSLPPGGAGAFGDYLRAVIASRARACRIILPQAMGPVDGRVSRSLAARSLRLAASVSARDRVTRDFVKALGLSVPGLCPDIAFLFPAAPAERAHEILDEVGVGAQPFLAMTPNMRVYERSAVEDGVNAYVAALARIARDAARTFGAKVLMIPHESAGPGAGDSTVIDEVTAHLGNGGAVHRLHDAFSAAEVKAVIGRAELVVGSRYHSLIAALSMRVPCVPISWSHKYDMLMQDVGLDGCTFRMDDLNYDALFDKVSEVWERRHAIARDLDAGVGAFELQVARLFDDVAQLIAPAASSRGEGR